jgi:hypothetical protein
MHLPESDVHMGNLTLQPTDALLYLAHVLTQGVERAPDMTQMLQNDVVDFRHRRRLA